MNASGSRFGIQPKRLALICAVAVELSLIGAGALCAYGICAFHPAGAVRETRTGVWLCQVPDTGCGQLRAR
jgi:hypothetical protein